MDQWAREAIRRLGRRRDEEERRVEARRLYRELEAFSAETAREFYDEVFTVAGGAGPFFLKVQTSQANSATASFSAARTGNILVAFCMHDAATAPSAPAGWATGFFNSTGSNARSGRLCFLVAAGGETSAVFGGTLTSPKVIFGEYHGNWTPTARACGATAPSGLTGVCNTTVSGTSHATTAVTPTSGAPMLLVVCAAGLKANTTATWSAEAITNTVGTVTEDLAQGGMVLYSGEIPAASGSTSAGTAVSSASTFGMTGLVVISGRPPRNAGNFQNPAIF